MVNVIATNKYIEFVQPLVDSLDKYFLIDHKLTVNVFSDSKGIKGTERVSIIEHTIPAYKFPEATLLRYHIMTSITYDTDYIFYLDADMLINDFVGEEILGDLVAVRHPGFYISGEWGSNNTPKGSTAYLEPINRVKYYAGGFQGGSSDVYLKVIKKLAANIDIDTANGLMADYHDETHWNHFLATTFLPIHELTPEYCMPQAWAKRVYSKIQHLPAKILALEKDFNYYR